MNNFIVNITSEASSNTFVFWEKMFILDACSYTVSVLFGFPTNSYVLFLIVTGTGSGVTSEFFNFNLSVCEIGISLNSVLYLIYFCTGLKQLAWLLLGLITTGRPLFQCLICVERYLAVVHPVTFLKLKPLRYRVICCAVVWILTLASCLCFIFNTGQLIYYIYFFSIQFLLFLIIQLFCLVSVLRALKQSGPGDRNRERIEENHMKRRAFFLILITTVSMTVIYVPFAIAGLLYILTHQYFPEPYSVGLSCYMLAGFVQPVLYLKRVGKLSCN